MIIRSQRAGLKDLESERASKNEKLTVIKIRKGNENAVS